MKSKLNVLGFSIGTMLIVAGFGISELFNFAGKKGIVLALYLSGIMIVGFMAQRIFSAKSIEQDEETKRECDDERNIMIREKASYNVNCINIVLLGIAVVVFASLNYKVPAIITMVILVADVIIFIVSSKILEKRY